MIRLADNLALPLDAVTETFGILGQRGAGKSNAAVVMAEEIWDAGLPWVAVDPKGDWWGMRSSADGTEPGLPLPVFGGLHGDLPIDPHGGALVADVIVDENITAVVDVSDLSKGERARFLVDFFDRLYRRHRQSPAVRHVFLEEAHEYIPQMVGREEGRLKEAAARLVLQGRTFGLGCSVCSQRSARIHKDVLSQVGNLVAMRTLAELDRKAIEAWVTEHNVAKELLASLPSLANGEAWLWSPSFLGRAERFRFRRRRTFDSGATPKVGVSARPPATLADVDLDRLRARLDTVATEPVPAGGSAAKLRARVAELERQLAARPEPIEKVVEVPAVTPEQEAALAAAVVAYDSAARKLAEVIAEYGGALASVRRPEPARIPVPREPAPAPAKRDPQPAPAGLNGTKLGRAERAVLAVLAQHPAGRTRTQLALLTGYSIKSSSLSNALGALRAAGLVTKGGEPIQVTADGAEKAAVLGDVQPLPTGRALYEWWAERLGRAERAVLDVLVAAWPDPLDKDVIAARTGYSATSSSLSNALGKLRSLDLVAGWAASSEFMEATK